MSNCRAVAARKLYPKASRAACAPDHGRSPRFQQREHHDATTGPRLTALPALGRPRGSGFDRRPAGDGGGVSRRASHQRLVTRIVPHGPRRDPPTITTKPATRIPPTTKACAACRAVSLGESHAKAVHRGRLPLSRPRPSAKSAVLRLSHAPDGTASGASQCRPPPPI